MLPAATGGELIIEDESEALVPTRPAQDVVAMLLATKKYTVPEIARATTLSETRIYALRESPLFMTLVKEYERRFTLSNAESMLMDPADAQKTVETLRSYRDGNFTEKSPEAAIRLRAAQTLFDRQIPKIPSQFGSAPPPRVTINISSEKADKWKELVNYHTGEVIDVTADGPTDDPADL